MKKMKFLVMLLMVMSLPVVFNSCSDDDKDENDSIVGTWKFKDVTIGEVKTNSTDNDSKIAIVATNLANKDFRTFTYTFAADGSCVLTNSYGDDPGTYTFTDGTLKLVWGVDDYDVYKASIVNGILTFEEDYTRDCNDLELNELIAAGVSDLDEFSVTKATAKVNFSKQ